MGFIGHNKRFMWAAVGAPGSTHDSRLLQNCEIFSQLEEGHVLPNRSLNLYPHGEIPITTVGDSAFPSRPWLLKPYKEGTLVPKQRYFNNRLCSARVVSEHAYGMLKGRFRILYKKTECSLDNIQVIIMVCIVLHNICIHRNDPCKPRWRLEVDELNLIRGSGQAGDADTIWQVIADWLWGIRERSQLSHKNILQTRTYIFLKHSLSSMSLLNFSSVWSTQFHGHFHLKIMDVCVFLRKNCFYLFFF